MARKLLGLILLCFFQFQSKAQTIFFSDDFSSGLASWTSIDNSGGGHWDTTITGSADGSELNSISASNGYAIFDSYGLGDDSQYENADLVSERINCSSASVVKLKFTHYLASAHMFNTGLISVSTDSITWTDILLVDVTTANAVTELLDISAIAGNQDSVYIKFNYQGDYNFFWMIDDVSVYEPVQFDLNLLESIYSAKEYSLFPKNMDLESKALVSNDGTSALSNVELARYIYNSSNSLVFSDSIIISSLSPSEDSLLTIPADIQFQGSGNYTIRFSASSLESDQLITNNVVASSITVSDSTFARDKGTINDNLGFGGGESGILGQNFTITSSTYATSLTFYLTNPNLLDTVSAVIYTVDSASGKPLNLIARTVTRNIIPGQNWYTLKMRDGNLSLSPGTYFIGVNNSPGYNITLGLTDSIYTDNTVWVKGSSFSDWRSIFDQVGIKKTFVLRLNTSANPVTTRVSADSPAIRLYPNPFEDQLNVTSESLILKAEVLDITGKIIFSMENVSGKSSLTLDLSGLPVGPHFFKMTTKDNSVIQKMIKK